MKFKGRNGGMAVAVRNHIMLFRSFVVSLFVAFVPTIIFVCADNPYLGDAPFWVFFILPVMLLTGSYSVFSFRNAMIGCF